LRAERGEREREGRERRERGEGNIWGGVFFTIKQYKKNPN
jgi:hypothetical protein